MNEDTTILQLTYLLSGIIRRIHGKPLDKEGDMRFIKLNPEQHSKPRTMQTGERQPERRTHHGKHSHPRPAYAPCSIGHEPDGSQAQGAETERSRTCKAKQHSGNRLN